jgi:uncharacterized protein (DUF362 family)/plasmid stability protein
MGDLTDTIRRELRERAARHAGRPDRELLEHLVVALQRERVAAVGFDADKLGDRLEKAPLAPEARAAIRKAVGQIWLDENMHARYVLGVLMRQRDLSVQLEGLAADVEGGVGGWMTAVEQHQEWAEAPGQRAAAAVIELGGRLSGRITPEIARSLRVAPLGQWCAFSADAETSAVLSFQRMIELSRELAARGETGVLELPDGFTAELERMAADEAVHRRIFDVVLASLGDDDGFVPGVSVADFVSSLESVLHTTSALGTSEGSGSSAPNPVGRGSRVAIARGTTDAGKLATFDEALRQARFVDEIEARATASGKPRADVAIVIKIDLMLAYHRDDRSSFVDPELIEHLVGTLYDRGFRNLAVCDAQNVYGRYYENRTVAAVGAYVGLRPVRYRLVDLSLELEPHAFSRGMGVYSIARSWRDADVRISFAKLKTHPIAVGQLTLRNCGTVLPQGGEYFFSDRVTEFASAAMAVLTDFPPHFGLVDGYAFAADGLLGVMADPTPKHPKVIVAGADVAIVDYVTLLLMGERDPSRAPDLRMAFEWFGDPRATSRLVGDATPIADWDRADEGLLSAPLAALASPVYASFSMEGALFTADMDAAAFPPIGETRPIAAARRVLRGLLGIGRR